MVGGCQVRPVHSLGAVCDSGARRVDDAQRQNPAAEYAKLADEFNPKHFDANEWARVAKAAGMKYIVLTARHHDGFALWDSPASYGDFDSMETAAHRDFVVEYTKACRDAGLRSGFITPPMDWRFPSYFKPKEPTENAALMKKQGYGQIEELMSKYGRIDVLWYDGGWLAHEGTDADAAWFWERSNSTRWFGSISRSR